MSQDYAALAEPPQSEPNRNPLRELQELRAENEALRKKLRETQQRPGRGSEWPGLWYSNPSRMDVPPHPVTMHQPSGLTQAEKEIVKLIEDHFQDEPASPNHEPPQATQDAGKGDVAEMKCCNPRGHFFVKVAEDGLEKCLNCCCYKRNA